MRLFDLYEDIPRPPRNLRLFVRNRLKEALELQAIYQKLKELDLSGDFGEDVMYDTTSRMEDDSEEQYRDYYDYLKDISTGYAAGLPRKIDDYFETLKWTNELFDSLNEPGIDPVQSAKLAEYVAQNMKRLVDWAGGVQEKAQDFIEPIEKLAAALPQVRQTMEELDLLTGEYGPPEEAERWLEAIQLGGELVKRLKGIATAGQKFQEMVSHWEAHSYGQQPKPKEQEVLYHATAFADEIAGEGFRPTKPSPSERYGIGSYGDESTTSAIGTHISFTHDIHNARQIMRAMRELVMIANGQIRKHHILRWMADEGMDLGHAATQVSGVAQQKAKVAGSDFEYSTGRPDIEKTPDTPEFTAELYKYWLYLNKIGRMNPVFANIDKAVRALKGRKPEDVGIIKALVNMEDPTIEYVAAEQEWRVPPSAVLNVERVQ